MITATNEDNMELMARYPDGFFNLSNDDPPYFKGPDKRRFYGSEVNKLGIKRKDYGVIKNWEVPSEAYFNEVKRVSRNQIIWGANYYDFIGTPFKTPRGKEIDVFIKENPIGWIIWDKCNGASSFNDYELAWTSFDIPTYIYKFMWNGMLQGSSVFKGHVMQGNKSLNQKKIHPTEKPIMLYDFIHQKYTKERDKVLSNFMGSGADVLSSLKFNIDFYAAEYDKRIFNEAMERLAQHQSQLKMF
jgi:site-specific DNA-methyltransferase (adenine-specific)